MLTLLPLLPEGVREMIDLCHGNAVRAGWWSDINTGLRVERSFGETVALIHSEIGEAYGAWRLADKADPHIPTASNFQVEMADTAIRLFDNCGGFGIDLAAFTDAAVVGDSIKRMPPGWHHDIPYQLGPNGNMDRAFNDLRLVLDDWLEAARKMPLPETALWASKFYRGLYYFDKNLRLDLPDVIRLKVAYNAQRADHKRENRAQAGGKAF